MWNRKLEDEVDSPTKVPTAGNWNRMQITLVEAAAFKPKKTSEGTPQCLATPNMVKISLANGHV